MERFKGAANGSLGNAAYWGKNKHFTFENYVTLNQKAHSELARLLEPVPENKKVRDFLEGISDSKLEQAKLYVLGSPAHLSDFTLTANYISQVADTVSQYQGPGRQVSALEKTDRPRGGTRQQGGGRGGGRGRVRGRGSGRGSGGSTNDVPFSEWKKLSEEEQQKIREKREVKTARSESKRADSEAAQEDEADESEIADNAGLQFGRKGKKSKQG